MALVTIQRSPSPSTDNDGAESSEDVSDGRSQIRKSLSESYFTVKGAALILPHNECTRKTTKKSHGGEMQSHLQAMLHILRPEDTIKIAIRLEDLVSNYHRYMALVSTRGRQDTEECVILGLDCSSTGASVGLVLPVWLGLRIKLGGDGGFSLYTDENSYLFKPVSVQAMWSAIQSLVKTINMAETMKYIHDGLTHTWVGYYRSRVNHADVSRCGQWNIEGIEVFAPSSLSLKTEDEKECIKRVISQKLREVMMVVDLDEATSIGLRRAVEEKMGISLTEFKGYFDEEVMRILGQMDEPSEILDFLYLGSEWNASNLEELKAKGIGYILNVTKEIDNFFMGMFQYYTVRVYDIEESDLLKHWDKTYKFICRVRNNNSKVLVHCKMGISRSASTVMAFLMKDRRWSVDEAFKFVKSRRSVVGPNAGFMEQLHMYEGILTASNKRDIFRCKSDQNLLDDCAGPRDDIDVAQGSFLGDSLFRVMSHSDWSTMTSGGVAHTGEWTNEMQLSGGGASPELMRMETGLEAAENRSADSVEMSSPDTANVGVGALTDNQQQGADIPVATSQKVKEGVSPPPSTVESSLWAADDDINKVGGGGVCVLGSRSIKPDSCWIKPDSLDLGFDQGESSTDDPVTGASCHSVPATPVGTTLLLDQQLNVSARQRVKSESSAFRVFGAVETESTDCAADKPSKPDHIDHQAQHFAKTSVCSSVKEDKFRPIDDRDHSLQEHTHHTHSETSDQSLSTGASICKTNKANKDVTADKNCPKTSCDTKPTTCTNEPPTAKSSSTPTNKTDSHSSPTSPPTPKHETQKPKVEMGVRQYFFREKIPWSPGKVQKMREGINKTGHLPTDESMEEGQTSNNSAEQVVEPQSDPQEKTCPCDKSFAQPKTASQPAHASMEEVTVATSDSTDGVTVHDGDGSPLSLYEKEEIPLEPGTVLRTRREIEQRHRFMVCTENDKDISPSRGVVRSSSLKHERTVLRLDMGDNPACLERDGLLLSPSSNRMSLDDLRRVGGGEINLDAQHPDALKTLIQEQSSNKSSLQPLSSETPLLAEAPHADRVARVPDTDPHLPPIPKGNLDSETLALIREIGSALLMSPSCGSATTEVCSSSQSEVTQDEQPSSNMVNFFVRKIEQQQPSPATNADHNTPSGADVIVNSQLQEKEEDTSKTKCSNIKDNLFAKKCSHSDSIRSECINDTYRSITCPKSVDNIPSSCLQDVTFSTQTEGKASRDSSEIDAHLYRGVPEAETEAPTVRHLVGKFESSSEPTNQSAASNTHATIVKTLSHQQDILPSSQPGPQSSPSPVTRKTSAPPALGGASSSTSTSPSLNSPQALKDSSGAPQTNNVLHGSGQEGAQQTGKRRSLIDFDIPVELVEFSPPCHTHPMQQIKPSSLGPRPFSRHPQPDGAAAWRSVRPHSCSDHRQAIGCDTLPGGSNVAQQLPGKDSSEVDSCPSIRPGGGEEGRKKRRLHGKSLPLPSAFTVEEIKQQQKTRLGQGPFYSSM